MEVESKAYSWKWVTAAELLSHGACEFLYARLTITDTSGSATLYDGENDKGTVIVELVSGGDYNCEANPCVPIYCRRGLYIGKFTTARVLVQWRELGHKGEGG